MAFFHAKISRRLFLIVSTFGALLTSIAPMYAANDIYSSSTPVQAVEKSYSYQIPGLTLSAPFDITTMWLGTVVPSTHSITVPGLKVLSDGAEVCNTYAPYGTSYGAYGTDSGPYGEGWSFHHKFLSYGDYVYGFYTVVPTGGGWEYKVIQRCKLDGSQVWTSGDFIAGQHNGSSRTPFNLFSTNIAALFEWKGLCYVTEDASANSAVRCIGFDKLNGPIANFNDNYYTFTDKPTISEQIPLGSQLSSIYVKSNADVPTGMSYSFEIATLSTMDTLFTWEQIQNNEVDIMMDQIMFNGHNNPNGQSIYEKLTLGAVVNFGTDKFVVNDRQAWDSGWWDGTMSYNIRFEPEGGGWANLDDYGPWGGNPNRGALTMGSNNFTTVPVSSLDGLTEISLQDAPAGNVWYRITLFGGTGDHTRTPMISSVKISNTAYVDAPLVQPDSGNNNTTSVIGECKSGTVGNGLTCTSSGTISATCTEPSTGYGEKVFVYRSDTIGAGTYKLFAYDDANGLWSQVGSEVRPAGSVSDAATLGASSPDRNSEVSESTLASGKTGFESFMSGAVASGAFGRQTWILSGGRSSEKTVDGAGQSLQFWTDSTLFWGTYRNMLFSMVVNRMSGQVMEFVAKDCSGNWKSQVSVRILGIIDGDSGSTQFLKPQGNYGKLYK